MIALLLSSLLSLVPAAHREAATLAAVVHAQDPDLLLAIAYVESRYKPGALRKARGGTACGVMQVRARSAEHCERMRADIVYAYSEGARVLRDWINATPDLAAALRGWGCGWQLGIDRKPLKPARPMVKCNGIDRRVLALRDRLRMESNT